MNALSSRLDLPLGEEASAIARRTVRDLFAAWGLGDGALLDDVHLVVSELVGNAVRHGGQVVVLEVEAREQELYLAVSDGSAVVPRSRRASDDDEDGRGIMIIEAVTACWGVEQLSGGGKRVWAVVPRP